MTLNLNPCVSHQTGSNVHTFVMISLERISTEIMCGCNVSPQPLPRPVGRQNPAHKGGLPPFGTHSFLYLAALACWRRGYSRLHYSLEGSVRPNVGGL
jgi:hypothetical protein